MIKFNKQDIGLYVALGIVGAGVGLLTGGLVAGYLQRRREVEEEEWVEVTQEDIEAVLNHKDTVEDVDTESEATDRLETPEWKEFVEEFNPSKVQVAMYAGGAVSMDTLRAHILEHQEVVEPYSYHSIYKSDTEQPPLSELVPEISDDVKEQLVNERYMVITDVVEEAPIENALLIYYDPEDSSWVKLSGRGHPVPLSSIDEYIDTDTWEIVLPLVLRGANPIYVEDYNAEDKIYRFELLPEEPMLEDVGAGKTS